MPVFALSEDIVFPDPRLARWDGLLAVGGDLCPQRLVLAYSKGIFPWYGPGEPILWWSPDPRLVLLPGEIHISRRLARTLRSGRFSVTFDRAFGRVIRECASVRTDDGEETWITPEMVEAYERLFELGVCHSVEAWEDGTLVGGLYGISLGGFFSGESMFHRSPDASKAALAALADFAREHGFLFIDCQVETAHLVRMGARKISRGEYLSLLKQALKAPTARGFWEAGKAVPCAS